MNLPARISCVERSLRLGSDEPVRLDFHGESIMIRPLELAQLLDEIRREPVRLPSEELANEKGCKPKPTALENIKTILCSVTIPLTYANRLAQFSGGLVETDEYNCSQQI